MKDWKRKKVAVLVRRSQGETGTPKDQLARIMPIIEKLEKKGKIAKVKRAIVGKDIDGKKKFKRERDLIVKGDIFNEGRGTSAGAFKPADRPVLMELLRRMKEGQYEAVLAENMDRFSRDPLSFAAVALPLWREDKKIFWGLADNEGWGANLTPHEESIIVTKLMWGGEAKKAEGQKSRKQLRQAIYRGSLTGSKPEWLGAKSKAHGLDYRAAWEEMVRNGENAEGNVRNPTAIAEKFGKINKSTGAGDNKWTKAWYEKMKAWNELGVLYNWLDGVEKVNDYIRSLGGYPRNQFQLPGVKNVINSTKGYFSYPAGVNLANTDLFYIFPDPADLDLEQLAIHKDPTVIEGFEVIEEPVGNRNLVLAQTQPRAKKR